LNLFLRIADIREGHNGMSSAEIDAHPILRRLFVHWQIRN
jgi:hypothetical protein